MRTRAIVVGSLVMDLAFSVPRLPAEGDHVIASAHASYRGGKGYNQAVALARLGAEVTMVGAVGVDAYGVGFREALDGEGVDSGRVVGKRGTPTGVAVPLVTPDGAVSYVQYPGANRYLAPAHAADLPDCDVLMLQGEINAATSRYAAEVIHSRGGLVVLRPAPAEAAGGLAEVADVVVGNEAELSTLLGARASGESLACALAEEGRGVVVTLGPRGAAWCDPHGGSGTAPAPSVTAVDTTGSGASFDAALAIALASGASYEDATRRAAAAGALAATVRGAEPGLPTAAAVDALLAGDATGDAGLAPAGDGGGEGVVAP